jgi:hypothetical protein
MLVFILLFFKYIYEFILIQVSNTDFKLAWKLIHHIYFIWAFETQN